MLTKAQIKQAEKALQIILDRDYTKEEQETLAFFHNRETHNTYSWIFVFPEDSKRRTMMYNFETKSVVTRRVG